MRERWRKVADSLAEWRKERLERAAVAGRGARPRRGAEFENLPAGVRPERITIEFAGPQQALEKLLARAMAIGNDFERFDRITRPV